MPSICCSHHRGSLALGGTVMGSRRLLRRFGYLGIALVLSLAGSGTASRAASAASTAVSTAAGTARPATPNRFDPTSRATSAKPAPAAGATTAGGRRMTASRQRPTPRPVTVALDPSRPVQITSGDQALELDVPAGAVSAADVTAAGGSMSLLVRQVVP